MSLETNRFYKFENFRLDPSEKALLHNGTPVPMTPKVFDTLEILVENAGRLLEKGELMERIWRDRFVEEGNLTFNIKMIRKALGDDAAKPRFIETVPRRGYRFIARIEESPQKERISAVPASNGRRVNESVAKTNNKIAHNDFLDEKIITDAPPLNAFSKIRLRPVFYSAAAILIGMFLFTGFFTLTNQTSFFQRFKTSTSLAAGFLSVEKLTDTGDANSISISPDGKLLAYITVEGGKNTIWLRQFVTGKSVPVISSTEETYIGSNFSRDGEFIIYFHRRGGEPAHLSRVSILGGPPTLVLDEIHGSYSPSPDDRQIAYTKMDAAGSSIMIADADGKNERQVFSSPRPRYVFSVDWSPDGKSIAYLIGNGEYSWGGKGYGVMELSLEDGTQRSLTDFNWSSLQTVTWLSDKSGILVTGREKLEGTNQIWSVSLPDGRAEQITDDSDSLVLRGVSADFSKIVATQESLNSSVWVAPADNLSEIKPIAKARFDVTWTADGKLIFPTKDTVETDIWLTNADGGDKKQLTANNFLERHVTASPDGRFIAYISTQSGRRNVWRMDIGSGDSTQITNGEGEIYPVFTPDSLTIVFNSIDDGSLWRVPVEGGEAIRLTEEKSNRVTISPEGTRFAYYGRQDNKRKILVRSFPECKLLNEFEVVINVVPGPSFAWAADGKSLVYESMDLNYVGNLWRQRLDGGEPQKLTNFTSEQIYDFAFSPDGRYLALVRGSRNYDAVLLKGFK